MAGTTRRKGLDVMIYANTGTPSVPIWTVIAGQRNAAIQESLSTMDVTGKDSDQNQELEPAIYSAKITCDGVYCPTDAAYQALKDAIRNKESILVRTRDGDTYEQGTGIVTSKNIEGPYEEGATYSLEIAISGGLSLVE